MKDQLVLERASGGKITDRSGITAPISRATTVGDSSYAHWVEPQLRGGDGKHSSQLSTAKNADCLNGCWGILRHEGLSAIFALCRARQSIIFLAID